MKDRLLLSAYLDGEVNARERQRLETRLRSDTQLRAQLDELRITRALIRALPHKKAPRSFALTPEMIKSGKRSGWVPTLGLTSAASTLLALVLLFFQFAPRMMMASAPSTTRDMQPEIAMFAEDESSAAEAVAKDAEAPEIILWGAPPVIGRGGGNSTEMMPEAPQPMLSVPIEEPATAEEAGQPEMDIQTEANADGAMHGAQVPEWETESIPQEEMQAAPAAPQMAPPSNTQNGYGGGPILGIRPTEETTGQVEPLMQDQNHSPYNSIPTQTVSPVNLMLAIAILLIVIALASGTAALILRRRAP